MTTLVKKITLIIIMATTSVYFTEINASVIVNKQIIVLQIPSLHRGGFDPSAQPPTHTPVFLSHVFDTEQFPLQLCEQFLP